jgi:hypothetical protein
MPDIHPPYRGKAAVIGIFGGLFGAWAMHYWMTAVAPRLFAAPEDRADAPNPALTPDPVESTSPLPRLYRGGETAFDTAARVFYRTATGLEPMPEKAEAARGLLHYAYFAFIGAAYGGSRTARRPRDIAGGFFFGLRLFAAETLAGAWLGFRPGPTRFTLGQHFRRLAAYWAFTFTSTQFTRLVYWLLTPEHRGDPDA